MTETRNFIMLWFFVFMILSPSIMSAHADLGTTSTSIGGIDISNASPVEGSLSAPITMIEFGDYQCPHCDAWFKNSQPTIKTNYIDTDKVKFYFVDIPYLGLDSSIAAEASYCAADQGRYWEYHNMLYSNQGPVQSGWAGSNYLKQFASKTGLDMPKFNSCLDSGKYANRVSYNKEIATSHGVRGTPTFFIVGTTGNVKKIEGDQPTGVFTDAIDSMNIPVVPEFGSVSVIILSISISAAITVAKNLKWIKNISYV